LQVNDEFVRRLSPEISRFVQRLEREYNEATIDYRDYTVYTGTAGWLRRLVLKVAVNFILSLGTGLAERLMVIM